MSKHAESQRQAENLRMGNEIASPGVRGVVLVKGKIVPASNSSYAGVNLLTTVQGNDLHPFRSALWYYDDDTGRWQSGSGQNYQAKDLAKAIKEVR